MQNELKRVINLPLLTFYGIGSILGAGIYVLISKIAGISGIYMPISFLVAGVIAGFSAFSYAELSSRFPKSAGEAVYINEAFSIKWLSILVGWAIVLVGIVSVATLANGIVGYVALFINIPDWITKLIVISILYLVAIWGVAESLIVASIITIIEIVGILLVLFYGFESILSLPNRWNELIPSLNSDILYSISFGAFLSFYAYIGFEDMVNMAEEVKDPKKNMPRSIIIVLIVTTLLYFLVSIVAVFSLPLDTLVSSEAPFADIISKNGDFPVVIIGAISLVAVINGMLIQIIMGSRVLYGMSKSKMAPKLFSYLSPKTRIPIVTTSFVYVFIVSAALLFPLVSLAKVTSTIILLVFSSVNLSLFTIKIKDRSSAYYKNSDNVNYPILIPAIGFLLCIGFLIIQIKSI